MKAPAVRRLRLFADYHQILAMDDGWLRANDTVTQEDVRRRLGVSPYGAVIHTARNMTVPVSFALAAKAPEPPPHDCDHVTESSLTVVTGRFAVMGLMDDPAAAARFAVAPGLYRLRVCHKGLRAIRESGLEGEDSYELTLWPAPLAPPRVLRQFVE